MAMDVSGMNSMVNRVQMQNAQQVVQSHIGALKHDEVKEASGEEHPPEPTETLSLSAAAEPSLEQELASAENSGDLSQVDPQLKNKDNDRVERGAEHARHLAEGEHDDAMSETGQTRREEEGLHTRVDGGDHLPRRTEEELIHAALADLPDDIKKVSGEMVINQINGTQVAPSLARLHNIPEPAVKELTAAPMLTEPMEIHDVRNQPLVLEPEAAAHADTDAAAVPAGTAAAAPATNGAAAATNGVAAGAAAAGSAAALAALMRRPGAAGAGAFGSANKPDMATNHLMPIQAQTTSAPRGMHVTSGHHQSDLQRKVQDDQDNIAQDETDISRLTGAIGQVDGQLQALASNLSDVQQHLQSAKTDVSNNHGNPSRRNEAQSRENQLSRRLLDLQMQQTQLSSRKKGMESELRTAERRLADDKNRLAADQAALARANPE